MGHPTSAGGSRAGMKQHACSLLGRVLRHAVSLRWPLGGKSCPVWFPLLAPRKVTGNPLVLPSCIICKVEAVKLTPRVTMRVSDTQEISRQGLERTLVKDREEEACPQGLL